MNPLLSSTFSVAADLAPLGRTLASPDDSPLSTGSTGTDSYPLVAIPNFSTFAPPFQGADDSTLQPHLSLLQEQLEQLYQPQLPQPQLLKPQLSLLLKPQRKYHLYSCNLRLDYIIIYRFKTTKDLNLGMNYFRESTRESR